MKLRAALPILFLIPLVALAAPPAKSAKTSDRDFVLAATLAGQQEVHDAALAMASSRMEPVRQMAHRLHQDHMASNAKLSALAHDKAIGVPVTTAAASPTPSFSDTEYVAAQIQAHEDAVALFTNEADEGSDADFRSFARQQLPVLRSHLNALRALQTP